MIITFNARLLSGGLCAQASTPPAAAPMTSRSHRLVGYPLNLNRDTFPLCDTLRLFKTEKYTITLYSISVPIANSGVHD